MSKKLFFPLIIFSVLSNDISARHWRPFGLPFFESRVDILKQSSGKMFPEWGDLIEQMEHTYQSHDIKIYETKDGKRWGIEIGLPGFNEDEIKITIKGKGILTITAKTKKKQTFRPLDPSTSSGLEAQGDQVKKDKEDRVYIYKSKRKEKRFFSKTFKLPKDIDWQNSKETKLSYKDGILKIAFAKKKIVEPEEIILKLKTKNKIQEK